MSAKDAKYIDKNEITQIILDDGTVINVEDDNPFKVPVRTTKMTTTTQKSTYTRSYPTSTKYEEEKFSTSPGKKETYSRVLDETENCIVYESGITTSKDESKLRAPREINMNIPVKVINERKTATSRSFKSGICPICNQGSQLRGTKTASLRGAKKIQELEAVPVYANKVGEQVYEIEMIPGAKTRFIRTVVDDDGNGEEFIRGEQPVFTFKGTANQKFKYCSGGNYVMEEKVEDEFCPVCSRSLH